ncbi:MAG: DUF2911 domain-containing protein [Acidobacteriota bacterium]
MNKAWIVRIMLAASAATFVAGFAQAQDLHPTRRPSPMAMARVTLDDTYVRVVYSRPYLRGRDNIFGSEDSGALVPFGKVWRTGANEATEITVTGDVKVGDKMLPAGTYSVFSTPGENSWTVHFNSELGLIATGRFVDGEFTPIDVPATDVAVVSAKVTTLEEEVDQFTISFEEVEGGAHMIIQWATTEVRVPFATAG